MLRAYEQSKSLFLRLPGFVCALIIFGVSRLWGYAVFWMAARHQGSAPWYEEAPSYLKYLSSWDSVWYAKVAIEGYPKVLPLAEDGTVDESTWAFYPIFPKTAAFLSRIFGVDYYLAAASLAVVSGFAAAVAIYYLAVTGTKFLQDGDSAKSTALWVVAGVSFLPVAPILQVPYAESMNLFFLALALLFLMKRRWGWVIFFGFLTCLSRPVGVALGATAGLYWFGQFAQMIQLSEGNLSFAHKATEALKATWQQLASALLICAFALIWPAYAWFKTGQIDAYTATEAAWRKNKVVFPVESWYSQGERYLGPWGVYVVTALFIAFILLMLSRHIRFSMHPVLWIWCMSYAVYIALFMNPQSSTFRLLLPLFPLVIPLMTLSASRAYRWWLLIAGSLGQFWWVTWLWFYKPLPTGGDYPP